MFVKKPAFWRAFFILYYLFCTNIFFNFVRTKANLMDTKLTLKLDKYVIEEAKIYAASHNRSLSKIVESYLKSILDKNSDKKEEIIISPFVESLASDTNIPNDFDYKLEYSNYLTEKYK